MTRGGRGRPAEAVGGTVTDQPERRAEGAGSRRRRGRQPSASSSSASSSSGDHHSGGDPVLGRVSLRLRPGQLALVVGPPASGKTALARAIAGSMEVGDGSAAAVPPSPLAFLPQRPFIRTGSLLEAVQGVDAEDEADGLRAALEAAALWAELGEGAEGSPRPGDAASEDRDDGRGGRAGGAAPGGDVGSSTLRLSGPVGDGGRLLSGGQRVRVGLAAAVMQGPRGGPVVADCPLDPLDGRVARLVAAGVFGRAGALRRSGRAVVLVTRDESLLRDAAAWGVVDPASDLVVALRPRRGRGRGGGGPRCDVTVLPAAAVLAGGSRAVKAVFRGRAVPESVGRGAAAGGADASVPAPPRSVVGGAAAAGLASAAVPPGRGGASAGDGIAGPWLTAEPGDGKPASRAEEAALLARERQRVVDGGALASTPKGALPWWVARALLRRSGSCASLVGLALLAVLAQCVGTGTEVWVSLWADAAASGTASSDAAWLYLWVFFGLSLLAALLGTALSCAWAARGVSTSQRIVDDATAHVLAAPLAVHDAGRPGDLVARLGEDAEGMDLGLPAELRRVSRTALGAAAQAVAIAAGAPVALPLAAALAATMAVWARGYRTAAREVSRAEAAAEGPLMDGVLASALHADVLRAEGPASTRREQVRFAAAMDVIGSAGRAEWALESWMGWRAEALGAVATAGLGSVALLARRGPWAGLVPLGVESLLYLLVTYAAGLTQTLRSLVEAVAEAEAEGAKVERLLRFAEGAVGDGAEPLGRLCPGVAAEGSLVAVRCGPASDATAGASAVPGSGRAGSDAAPALRLDDVSLTYRAGGRPALRGVSLVVRAGEVVALCGRSGQGKSSVVAAASGLYPGGTTGSVSVCGAALACGGAAAQDAERRQALARCLGDGGAGWGLVPSVGATGSDARSLIAAVPQGCPVLGPTVLAELGLGPDASDSAWRALHEVGAAEWIRGKGGLMAAVGPERDPEDTGRQGGGRAGQGSGSSSSGSSSSGSSSDADVLGGLSEGQAQQLAAARAIVRLRHQGARLALVDECGSALPAGAAGKLTGALCSAARESGAAVVLVAHALKPLALAQPDRVVVMHDGRIVEQGPPHQLARIRDGWFAKLSRAQHLRASDWTAARTTFGAGLQSLDC